LKPGDLIAFYASGFPNLFKQAIVTAESCRLLELSLAHSGTTGASSSARGDGLLIEFRSVVDAVRCAIEVRSRHGRA